MTASECPREASVVAAIAAGNWPDGGSADLRAHVEECASCAEIAIVAPLLRDDYLAARAEVQVPGAGQVWWRSAVRARLEVAERAARPITWMQGVAGAGAAGLLVALVGYAWPSLLRYALSAASALPRVAVDVQMMPLITMLARDTLPLVIVGALCLVIAPVAVYLATSDE